MSFIYYTWYQSHEYVHIDHGVGMLLKCMGSMCTAWICTHRSIYYSWYLGPGLDLRIKHMMISLITETIATIDACMSIVCLHACMCGG